MDEKEDWIYSLRLSDDEEEEIQLFDNAGEIILKRFIITYDEILMETIHVAGGELRETIHDYFNKKKKKIKEALEDD